MNKYLEKHSFPDDLKKMDFDELELLTYEIRDFLVEEVSSIQSGCCGAYHSASQGF